MHGYETTRAVERTIMGRCSPDRGNRVHPVLREFEEGGYVTSEASVVSGRRAQDLTR